MSNKKQNVLIAIISVIGVAIIILMLHISGKDKTLGQDDGSESITLKVYYEDNQLVIDDTLTFNENETLLSLMDRTYDIKTKVNGDNIAILSIETYHSDFYSSYFALYVDGTYSPSGAKDLILTGGLTVEWKWTEL